MEFLRTRREFICLSTISLWVIVWTFFQSGNSPLWANPLLDDNWVYQQFGIYWTKGVVPFVDIFDAKGPALFFLYLPSALLFPFSGMGMYLTSVILFIFGGVVCFKIAKLFASNLISLCASIIWITYITGLHFECAENLFCGFLLFFLYQFLKVFMVDVQFNRQTIVELLLCGLGLGIVFWGKFSLLAIPLTLCFWTFIYCLYFLKVKGTKKLKQFGKFICLLVPGFLLVSTITCVYYIVNNSFIELIKGYFIAGFARSEHKLFSLAHLKGSFRMWIWTTPNIILLFVIPSFIILLVLRRTFKRKSLNIIFILAIISSIPLVEIEKNMGLFYYSLGVNFIFIISLAINIQWVLSRIKLKNKVIPLIVSMVISPFLVLQAGGIITLHYYFEDDPYDLTFNQEIRPFWDKTPNTFEKFCSIIGDDSFLEIEIRKDVDSYYCKRLQNPIFSQINFDQKERMGFGKNYESSELEPQIKNHNFKYLVFGVFDREQAVKYADKPTVNFYEGKTKFILKMLEFSKKNGYKVVSSSREEKRNYSFWLLKADV